MVQVTYVDRKGAGCMRVFRDTDKAARFLESLRCEAIAKDESGQVIGGVSAAGPGQCDDPRIKWLWWIEADA